MFVVVVVVVVVVVGEKGIGPRGGQASCPGGG